MKWKGTDGPKDPSPASNWPQLLTSDHWESVPPADAWPTETDKRSDFPDHPADILATEPETVVQRVVAAGTTGDVGDIV